MITLSESQARRFLLLRHGLLGEYRFSGKQGVLEFIRQAGCIQFDPVNACGRNAELTLQSRVKGFTEQMLYELLYRDRKLVDYPDKNLSILPVEAWPFFERYRRTAREAARNFPELPELEEKARRHLEAHGPASSDDLPLPGSIRWHSSIHWSGAWNGTTKASRAVLEQLYSTGELVIHHKKGTRKYYDLAHRHLSPELLAAPDPLPDDDEHRKWRVRRRIGAVGLLWNRPSDAWLNIGELDTPQRDRAFGQLLAEEAILEVGIDGRKTVLYCLAEDLPLIQTVRKNEEFPARCEVLAPLDCMMWDRKLIRALFHFNYGWEIYTPPARRKYGYYVLPLLHGDSFAGRVEAVADNAENILTVKNIWYETGVGPTKKLQAAVTGCLERLARLNGCREVRFPGTR